MASAHSDASIPVHWLKILVGYLIVLIIITALVLNINLITGITKTLVGIPLTLISGTILLSLIKLDATWAS